MNPIDAPGALREGENLNLDALNQYLATQNLGIGEITSVGQFPGGYSNLTYLLSSTDREYVLRRPPFGAKAIKGGHDMGREFGVLSALKAANFQQVPTPLLYCDDETVLGAPFYLMERVRGVILRATDAPRLLDTPPVQMRQLSEALCDNLVQLHSIDIEKTGLINIGKPEGYIRRQVEGWHQRYLHAQTEEIPAMNALADWLLTNMPADGAPTLLHNDYKYDNLVLDAADNTRILAILDWEMATVGDPLMDVGTALSYWTEAGDSPFEKNFNISWLKGNLTRREFAERYAQKSGRDLSYIHYFYAFGLFRNAVIIQQIYSRYYKGLTQDKRFAGLIHGVRILSEKGGEGFTI